MTEPDEIGVLEAGMSVANLVDGAVVAVHFLETDPPGTFRVRRGADVQAAYQAEEELVLPDASAVPWEWAVLADTGLEVKLLSVPGGTKNLSDGPIRVAVRPRIERERG